MRKSYVCWGKDKIFTESYVVTQVLFLEYWLPTVPTGNNPIYDPLLIANGP